MPQHKRTVHPGQPTPSPTVAEPASHSASYAGPWDLDPNWTDDQAEIDDLADAERIAPAAALLGWTDLEPLDIHALLGPATSPDQWGLDDASDYSDISEDVDDAEDQL